MARDRRVAHEVRPTNENGRVRAELPEALKSWHRVRGRRLHGGRPERRGRDGIREEDELGGRVPKGDETIGTRRDADGGDVAPDS